MRLISCAFVVVLLAWQSAADVNSIVGNNRLQQKFYAQRLTELDQKAYPAVGFRPVRPFNLPSGQNIQQQQQPNINFNDNQQAAPVRPNNFYATPDANNFPQQQQQQQPAKLQQQATVREAQTINRQQQLARQQQQEQAQPAFEYPQNPAPQFVFQQSQQFQFGPQQFPNPQTESARLTAEPEERETLENNSDDIEVNVENAAEEIPATRSAAAPLPPPQATVTYFPANAVNFVKPFQAGVPAPNPGATFIQYQPNVVPPTLAKVVAANPAPLPISAQYYASSAFLPSTVAFNSFTAFPRAAAPLQAW